MNKRNIVTILEEMLNLHFDEEEAVMITSAVLFCHFPKGTVVVHRGDEQHFLYLIREGIVRGIYLDEEGSEHTKCFSRENDFFSTEGFLSQSNATYDIECLEDVDCFQFPYEFVHNLIRRNQWADVLYKEKIVKEFLKAEAHTKQILELDAYGRYEHFCEDYPDLSKRLKQKIIASYIGVNPVSLSRIKRRMLT